MKTALKCTLLSIVVLVAGGVIAETAPGLRLLALSKTDHKLVIVDPQRWKVIAKIPVGPDPHEVIASSDGIATQRQDLHYRYRRPEA